MPSICRLCLGAQKGAGPKDFSVNIFTYSDSSMGKLTSAIEEMFGIKVSYFDPSRKICSDCFNFINSYFSQKRKFLENDHILKKRKLNSMSTASLVRQGSNKNEENIDLRLENFKPPVENDTPFLLAGAMTRSRKRSLSRLFNDSSEIHEEVDHVLKEFSKPKTRRSRSVSRCRSKTPIPERTQKLPNALKKSASTSNLCTIVSVVSLANNTDEDELSAQFLTSRPVCSVSPFRSKRVSRRHSIAGQVSDSASSAKLFEDEHAEDRTDSFLRTRTRKVFCADDFDQFECNYNTPDGSNLSLLSDRLLLNSHERNMFMCRICDRTFFCSKTMLDHQKGHGKVRRLSSKF